MDDVECTGTESTLTSCIHTTNHDCYHGEDAGVRCTAATNGALILSRYNITSTSYYYGTVRVYYNGWGNICDDYYYNSVEANVICHQLGYTGASSYSRAGLVSYGTDYLFMKWDDVNCASSSYLSIAQCSYSTSIDSGCTNSNSYDATVYCYTTRIWNSNPFPGMIRLQGGAYSNEGRVEVYCNGQWGTICSTGFGTTDANTICKQLGYDSYYRYNHLSISSGSSSQPIWSTNMYSTSSDRCYGTRNTCPSSSVTTCSHSNDVTISCREYSSSSRQTVTSSTCSSLLGNSANGALILSRSNTPSTSYYYGTVRVYYNGWGNICDDSYYGSAEANVICHQLGYTGASSYSRAGLVSYGTDYLSMKWDDVNCVSSSYLSIAQCSYSTSIDSGCTNSNSYDATVSCYINRIWNSNPFPGMIRLQGGAYSNEGRVEVYCNGQWGTICSTGFGTTDANTICKQLGYDRYYRYNHLSISSGISTQPIWSTNMYSTSSDRCYGTSNACPSSSVTTCSHSNDVTISCREYSFLSRQTVTSSTCSNVVLSNPANGAIILSRYNVSSTSYYYGTVRIYYNGWGNICDDSYYGSAEANVICHQLGYTGASSNSRAGLVSYGTDYLSMKWDDVNCASSGYLSIAQCSYSTYIDSGCTNSNSYDATVSCYTTRIWNSNPFPGMIRLQGGAYSNEGRVEVYCNGQWGTICSTGFGTTDANTICKQLGYDAYDSISYISSYSNYSQPIWSVNMYSTSSDVCFGRSNSCPSSSVSSCTHYNDVSITCRERYSSTRYTSSAATCAGLIASSSPSTGTIIFYRNGVSSPSYYYGIVQLYYNSRWGNICDDYYYGSAEANVICHQLGYTGASSYSRAGNVYYGTDYNQMIVDDVSCVNRNYLTLLQCSFSTYIDSGCTNTNQYDATVYCYTNRIWNSNPYSGMIRLQGGAYSNEGRVEVYCNGRWGTICDDGFSSTDARTVCKQLGYSYYSRYDHLSLPGSSSQPIWSRYFSSSSSSTCFNSRNSCPSSSITSCSHSEDVTVSCSYSSSYTNTATLGHCNINDTTPTENDHNISAIEGTVGGILIPMIVYIVCCVICCVASSKKKSKPDTSRRPVILLFSNISESPTK
ncbi:PREDICTED: deleted in malignant brain tumors 1 protein-like isoform X3 [Amphimedon queenslandica]|uniref:SRCR domain-containing protein n=1 Tax=Amphimedon queenslandica TaxID=400682 RepID=A0AAN0JH78_AMPQE|nr:PREDICTED: deleted in malignant brain tumors 1 protein-like isoform X3 [Amphimedon queenslandica]|eukprot:XP_019856385.1 PREDICTED: deleted in malignant brain tumors 1 protein-like isoform X3 [Amphimedon queenslandica]